jgi:hypothetical protein
MRSLLTLAATLLVSISAMANPPAAGCSSCETSKHSGGLIRIGQGCAMPHGCSSLPAERTFMFGSCKQFFNAGSDCSMKMHLNGLQPPIGPCVYNSYLNR